MGRKRAELHAYASLSAHNSDQDDRDAQAWAKFVAAVREIAERPEYAEIEVFIDAADSD